MSDKNIELTRRKALLGLGTVGAAAAGTGAGTFAYFSDTESSSGNTVSAGTLNLTADGNDGSATTTVEVSVAPGESDSGSTTLKNSGSLPGHLNFDLGALTNHENGVLEPEQGAPGEDGESTGELGRAHAAGGAHALDVRAGFDTDQDGNIETVVLDSTNKDPRNNVSGVTGIEYNPNEAIGNDNEVDFIFESSLPSDAGNAVQGDSVEFDITFELLQEPSGSSVAITGDSSWASNQPWQPTTNEAHTGEGSWYAGSQATKRTLYFGSEFSSFHDLPKFTVDDINDITYWLKSPEGLGGADDSGSDIYLTIYTKPEDDGEDASWYDSRLQALPADADGGSPNFVTGEWNEFGTSSSAQHQLRFYDHVPSVPKPAASDQPTLSDLQGGDYDWDDAFPGSSGDEHPENSYHDETVLALSLQTASGDSDLDMYLDDIVLDLSSSGTFSIDLEP